MNNYNQSTNGKQSDNQVRPLEVISIGQLLRNKYEPLKWIIPVFLPEGLTLFFAAPKMGKSMVSLALSLRMARRTAGGVEGDVLYLTLDDVNERRLQDRSRSLLQGLEVEGHLFFAMEAEAVDTGLIMQLERWMVENPSTCLIVADVLGNIKPKRIGDDIYRNDYEAMNALRLFAVRHHLAIILIHHTRKKKDDEDWINNVNGSTGLTGGCDTIWSLRRKRGSQDMKLLITGRDVDDNEIDIRLDDLDEPWKVSEEDTEMTVNGTEEKILAVLKMAGEALPPKKIAELAGLKTARMAIRRMLTKGQIVQTTYGLYTLSKPDEESQSNNNTHTQKPVTLVTLDNKAASEATSERVTKSYKSNTKRNSVTLEEPDCLNQEYTPTEEELGQLDVLFPPEDDTCTSNYDAACQLMAELKEAGAEIEWLPDGKRKLHAPPNTKWQQLEWMKRIPALDTELRDLCGVSNG